MNSISAKLAKKACALIQHYPRILLFLFIEICMLLAAEAIYFIFLYQRYTIHIFDETSFKNWQNISFFEFSMSNVFFFLLIYFCISLAVLLIKFDSGYYLMQKLDGKPCTIFASMLHTLKRLPVILHTSTLMTSITLLYIVELEYIKSIIRSIIRFLSIPHVAPKHHLDRIKLEMYLTVPILIDTKCTLKQALHKSIALMHQTFGDAADFNFSFASLTPIVIVISIICERIITSFVNQLAGIAALVTALGIGILLIHTVQLIIEIATYRYCTNKPTGPFTKEDFDQAFREI